MSDTRTRTRNSAAVGARTDARPAAPLGRLAAIGCLSALVSSCSSPIEHWPAREGVPEIRVLLLEKVQSAQVAIRGPYKVRLLTDAGEPRVLASGEELPARTVQARGSDVLVEGVVRTPCTVEFAPTQTAVELNGQRYRGTLRVSSTAGELRIVNVVDIESYLRGVVPSEVVASWPRAALEAQAVTARTYALAKVSERQRDTVHVRPTTADQVYGGCEKEDERTDAAIVATWGLVLRYRGRSFSAYYHACCGGGTADARVVFGEPALPLRGVECSYCRACPRYKWSFRISREKLAERINVPGLEAVTLQGVGLDGRCEQVTFRRANKEPLVLAGTEFRRRVGTWKTFTGQAEGLMSTRFTVKAEGRDFLFEGTGWGHGVGMCQWGAKGMADTGKSRDRILEHYYPGTEVTRAY